MHRSPPDVSSIDFWKLKQSFLQNKKRFFSSLFSEPELVQVFNYIPKEIRAIKFGTRTDFSLNDTDTICQAFRQLHDHVSTLDFTFNNLTTCKRGDELAQIFKAFPAGLQTLFLANLENQSADELVQIFAALPRKLRWLSIKQGGFHQKTTDELVRIFGALPKGLSSLDLQQFRFNANSTGGSEQDGDHPLQALPGLTYLNLSLSNLGMLPTKTVIQILKDLPDTLTALDLSATRLNQKYSLELIDILSAIPGNVTELSLTNNSLEKRPVDELKQLYQSLQSHVALLYLETDKLPIRFTTNINSLMPSKHLALHQPKKADLSAELILTTDEKKQEFGFLIALERSERALWRKNPRAYREDVNQFTPHLEQAGIPTPDEPAKAVNYFMAYAIKSIAQTNNYDKTIEELLDMKYRGNLVSKDNPMKVRGPSVPRCVSLWTSLVLLGSLIPDKKISPTDIKSGNSLFDPTQELGFFSLFSSGSFYHSGFKKHLNKEAIRHYLLQASTPLPEDEFVNEALDEELSTRTQGHSDRLEQIQLTTTHLKPENRGEPIAATQLCQLAKAGCLADIKKYTVSADEIDALVHHAIWGDFASTAGAYNALMVATAYRHLDIVQYFIEKKEADCAIKGGRHGEITLLDCAKRTWWFVAAADASLIQYLERAWLKHQQSELAHEFVDTVYDDTTGELDEDAPRIQLEMLINITKPESVCVEVVRAYEQSSNPLVTSTQTILTFLSQAVDLQDKEAALELGQRHQLNQPSNDINTAFAYYLKAAQMGQEEALIPLERLGKKASAAQKIELSQLYGSFFQDEDKAAYWRAKSIDISQAPLTLNQ